MQKLFNRMASANGEARTMACRYEGSYWYCLLSIVEQEEEFWERWEDLVGSDNDFFEARKYFEEKQKEYEDFVLVVNVTPTAALERATREAAKLIDEG